MANSDKQKHLDFIQLTIARMAANSFILKGWAVTLVSALFALSAKDSEFRFVFIAYIPIPLFWALDAYYLSQERLFRDLYNEVRKKDENSIDFDMKTEKINIYEWGKTAFSGTLFFFYGALILALLIVIWKLSNK